MPLNAGDFGFNTAGQLPGDPNPIVETFQGFPIRRNVESGYYWQEGGYYDTLAECRQDIADWNFDQFREDFERGIVGEDTPALERPWWEDR